jgi:hypothetical protein
MFEQMVQQRNKNVCERGHGQLNGLSEADLRI